MSDYQFKELGSYKMDAFHLTINTDNDLAHLDMDENLTLVHEYTHFLQSITTTYGWYRISNLAIIAQHLLSGIYKKNENDIREWPFYQPSGEDGNILESLISLNTMLEGSDGNEDSAKKINQSHGFYKIHSVAAETFNEYPEFDLEIMKLPEGLIYSKSIRVTYFFNPTGNMLYIEGNKIDVMLGAVCIYEFMAYALENHLSSKGVDFPSVPYLVVRDVSEHILEKRVDDSILMCFCEFSLQSRTPGETFYNLLESIKDKNIDPNSLTPDLMMMLFKAEYRVEEGCDTISYSAIGLLNKFVRETLEEYKILFSQYEQLRKIIDMLAYLNDEVNNYRGEDLFAISRLMFLPKEEAIKEVYNMINVIGLPPLFNNSGYIGHAMSTNSYDAYYLFMPMLSEFVNFTLKGRFSCGMYDTCKKYSPEVVNANCVNNVYIKGQEKLLCGVGQMIKSWGLNNYNFIA